MIVGTCEHVYPGRIVLVKLIDVGRPMMSQFLGPGVLKRRVQGSGAGETRAEGQEVLEQEFFL